MTLARFRELARTLPPDTLAVDDGTRAWTYRELDLRAEHLARHLATRGGAAPVALMARPDAPALAALLGALRAGRIIAPIEPRLPLLRQLEAGLALVDDDALAARLRADGWDGDVATIDELERAPAPISATPATTATHARAAATGDDAALVCFTSGSSGRPKGIVFTELSIAAGAAGYRDALALAPGDRLAWLAPLPFGASLTVAFGALLAGATLVPCDAAAGLGALAARLEAQRVTVLHLVPSLFRRLAAALAHEARPLPALRLVKLGGEASFASDLALFARAFPADARLVNGLGLTEACGNVCYASFAADARIDGPRLPVGRAALDTELGLVDGDGRAVADGETGRIVVAGPALAAGYWRDPDGSAAVWRALPGRRGRWLVTADLGRVDADGRLEHLGRADDVVKIRGQAVATGEVEAVVRGLDGVSAAAVVALPHPSAPGESVLAAFVVATRPIERATLAAALPEVMLPARIVRVAELPLLPSGKLDRQALRERLAERERDDATTPDPTIPTARPRRSRDALELQLLAAWEKALGVEDIQPDEDFFALGGHSLAAAEVMVFIANHLGIELPLATLLEHPTLGALAAVIRQRGWSAAASPAVVVRAGSPLERPLFAVGGTGVEVVVFRELARELQPLPLIGLQHHAVRGEPLRLMSVAGMARDFLPHVLRLQPRGPYRLLGASFGGRVAFELARLLLARGEEVELLAMLDCYGPGYLRWRPSRDLRASLLALRHLLAPGTRWSRDVGVGPMARALGHVLKRAYVALRIGLGRTAPPAPQQRHLHAVAVADVAKLATRHRPIDARIDLFRAAIQPAKEATAPLRELGWAGRARRGVVVHDIPGVHGDYLRAPVAGLVAARIRTLLGAVAPAPEAVDTPLPERDELV